MSPPSVTQSTPGAFAESVTNVRVLSWLLLGALHASQPCLPVPIECSQHMADYIHFVLAGFADQSKVGCTERTLELSSCFSDDNSVTEIIYSNQWSICPHCSMLFIYANCGLFTVNKQQFRQMNSLRKLCPMCLAFGFGLRQLCFSYFRTPKL